MKKKNSLLLLLFMFFSASVFPQITKFSIYGTVTDCKTHEPIAGAQIKLVCGTGSVICRLSDKKGRYRIDSAFSLPTVACILSCKGGYPYGFVSNSGNRKIMISDTSKTNKIKENFCLTDAYIEIIKFPEIFFKKDSAVPLSMEDQKSIQKMAEIMMDNPTFVISINSYSKKNKDTTLSVKQMKYVKDQLIALEIEPKRLVCSIRDASVALPKKDRKTKYISFSIVRKDYIPKYADEITGNVYDCKTKNPVKDVTIKIIGSNGSAAETTSDLLGNYSLKSDFIRGMTYIIKTVVADSIGRSKGVKYGNCPSVYYEKNGYLNSSEHKKFTYPDTLKNKTYNVCLTPMIVDYSVPEFYFKKNSTEINIANWGDEENTDTTCIDCFVSLLMANKHWTIEISGHASADENNKKALAEARAKKIFDLLVSKGIDPKRLFYKSYSDTRPFEFRDESTQKIIKKDPKIINEKSRRITISRLSMDFGLPTYQAPANGTKIKSNDDDE